MSLGFVLGYSKSMNKLQEPFDLLEWGLLSTQLKKEEIELALAYSLQK